jgi:general secretion pathway protein M
MVLAVIILTVQLVLMPYFEARGKLTGSIRKNEKILKEMIALESEYAVLRKGFDGIRTGIERRKGFTLFTHLEKKAGESGVRTNIRHMQPSRSEISGVYEEIAVEIRLEKITLKQLVNFLYAVESPENLVWIKRLSVKKSAESPQYLSALIQVATYDSTKDEGHPGMKL